jgi:hypothetical protein
MRKKLTQIENEIEMDNGHGDVDGEINTTEG